MQPNQTPPEPLEQPQGQPTDPTPPAVQSVPAVGEPKPAPPPPPPPEYGYPPVPPQYPAQPASSALAISSMVLGIIGFMTAWILIGLPLALIGLILGIVSIAKKNPGRGMAIAGIVTSAIALLFGIAVVAISIAAYQGINQRTSSTMNRSTASQITKHAEAYSAIMGSADGSQYPDYQTLVTQTEVPEAEIDQDIRDDLSDGSQHQASETRPVTYRGCTEGAIVSYWDGYTKQAKSIEAGNPSLCSFGQRT